MAYNIYLYDNQLVSDELENDSGRTRAIRDILCNIANNSAHYNDRSNVGKDVFIEPLICNLNNSPVTYIPEICNACNYLDYKTLIEPFILFIHTSNKCFYRFIDQFLAADVTCWIVCYSGADKADAFNTIMTKHSKKQNIRFHPYISPSITSQTMRQEWDINAFVHAVINQEENPFDRLVRKGTPHLIALSILCQGYLAARGGGGLNVWNDSLQGMLISDAKERTEKPDWWDPVWEDDGTGIEKELKQIEDDGNEETKEAKGKVQELISKIRDAKKEEAANANVSEKVHPTYEALNIILSKT